MRRDNLRLQNLKWQKQWDMSFVGHTFLQA